MSDQKDKSYSQISKLHPRSLHRERYDLLLLSKSYPALAEFVYENEYDDLTIDFFDPKALRSLNEGLLKHYYHIDDYCLPSKFLCPPIPGRADYIHYIADLLSEHKAFDPKNPNTQKIKCLDIGTGANCIYPILGARLYDWSFVGSDIDPLAIESANQILRSNNNLENKIELRLQKDPKLFFEGIIKKGEKYDISICNPPFHSSAKEAQKASQRKVKNLKQKKIKQPVRNFSGTSKELWCEGGEKKFILDMIDESKTYAYACDFFTTLVSKESNLPTIHKRLRDQKAKAIKQVEMGQGNKRSRIVVWRF